MKYNFILAFLIYCIAIISFSSCSNSTSDCNVNNNLEEVKILQLANNYFRALILPDSIYDSKKDSLMVSFGQQLFYDENLSASGNMSCNTCHPIEDFGMDRRRTAIGHNKNIGKRNTPTVLNAFLQYAQFWDARAATVEEQLIEPLLHSDEMGMNNIDEILAYVRKKYITIISEVFPDSFGLEELKNSIGSFERTLITPSKFDQFLTGEMEALSKEEQQGLLYFIQEGCTSCHSGVLLGGNMAQKFSLFGYYWDFTGSDTYDDGRYNITKNPSDKFLFKVSGLRNVAETGPYFHDGSVDSLYSAIDIMAKAELGKTLDHKKIKKIELFLKSLTGELKDYKAPKN